MKLIVTRKRIKKSRKNKCKKITEKGKIMNLGLFTLEQRRKGEGVQQLNGLQRR